MEHQAVTKAAQPKKTDARSVLCEPKRESSAVAHLMLLQRSVGNRALGRFLQAKLSAGAPVRTGFPQRKCACHKNTIDGEECADCAKENSNLQRKLTVGASNDPLEQEADRIADQVLARPTQSRYRTAMGQALTLMTKKVSSERVARTRSPRPEDAAKSRGTSLGFETIHRKASCACGGGCPACKSSGLRTSQSTDAAEIEADGMAERVMGMSGSETRSSTRASLSANAAVGDLTIHRKCDACAEQDDEEKLIERRALPTHTATWSTNAQSHVQDALNSGGRPLSRETLRFFEPRFGYDLSGIRVYADTRAAASARAIDAEAYTLGTKIVFGSGQYAPEKESGRHLLAHELAHAVHPAGESRTIHRKKRGAAGGCGICLDPTEAGIIAHSEIQMAFTASNPNIIGEFAVPVVEEGKAPPFVPEVDLSYETHPAGQKIMNIGEIKPLDDAGVQAGIARQKLKDYARELMANPELGYDEVFRMRDSPPSERIPFFNPNNPPGCPPQIIYVKRTEPGIYQYYCEPPWSDLVKDPLCKCRKKKEDDEKQKEKAVEKPESKEVTEKKEEKEKKPVRAPTGGDDSIVPYVLPPAIVAGVSAATAAYLRKRAMEEATRRAAQLAWRKAAEAATKRRVAAAAAKGAAGKAAAKAAVYVEIAAAAALIALYPERVEAKPGLGPSPIESLYKAMTTSGTPPSPEMKALIESDPVLKQLAEEAGGSGDGSKLQEEMARRTLQLIKDNPDVFSPEDLEFLTEYSKTASSGQTPETADQLRKAIDAAKAGKTGAGGTATGTADKPADGGTKETEGEKAPADSRTATGDKGDKPVQPGDRPRTPATTPLGESGYKGLNEESTKRIKEAPQPVSHLFQEFVSKQKLHTKLDDTFVKRFFEIVPADLTEKQSDTLIGRLTLASDVTMEAVLEALKKGVEEVRGRSRSRQRNTNDTTH
jgi:Domain of unknown function (DUF4157)